MQSKQIKIVLMGDTGVGKTSIVYSLAKQPFTTNYKPTIGVDFVNSNNKQIWDTAGQRRFMALYTTSFLRETDAFIFVVDGTKPLEIPAHIKTQLDNAKRASPDAKFYVVVNKWDGELHDDFLAEDIKAKLKETIAIDNLEDDAIFFCSAKTGESIPALFDQIARDFSCAPEEDIKLSSETSSTSNPILKQQPKLTKLNDVFLVGTNVIMLGSIALFLLAAFTAGSFLTFGILPSAFIGAAIIMSSALLVWTLGCVIYDNIVRNAHNSSSHNLDEDKSTRNLDDFDNSVDPKNTSTSSSSYGSNPLDQQQQENQQVDASSGNSRSDSKYNPSLGSGSDNQ